MIGEVAWSKLTVERASIMGLFNGGYIHAVNEVNVEFLLGYGVDRRSAKVVLIDTRSSTNHVARVTTIDEAKALATTVAFAMRRSTVTEVAAKLLT